MGFIQLGKGWHLLAAYIFDVRAARVEGTAVGQICQGRWAAGHTVAHTLIAELGQRVDQELRIGMRWLSKHLLCSRLFNDLSSIHDANPVSDVGMHTHIVRN